MHLSTRCHLRRLALLVAIAVVWNSSTRSSCADDSTTESSGKRRAVIICGLSGDADHRKTFTETINKFHEGLTKRLNFPADNIQILFGDNTADSEDPLLKSAQRSTREQLEKTLAGLQQDIRKEDTLWLFVLGHCHFDGRHSWLNLPGPDIHEDDFGKLVENLSCREQVFFFTTSTSGFYIKPTSANGRIVISATAADWESNETEFPHQLGRTLAAPPSPKDFDIDQDGEISLLDLYLTVVRDLAQSYVDREQLATEHGLLDDNGDGRGTELQIDFLTDQQGGRAKPNRRTKVSFPPGSDGSVAKLLRLDLKYDPPSP